MISRGDAALLVRAWADDAARTDGGDWTAMLEEFELGYVVWVKPPEGAVLEPGASVRRVIDRDTGEITTWGSLPAPMVADQYRRHRQTYPAVATTVDPVATIRRQATRPVAPTTAMHLRLGHDNWLRIAYGAKGDQELNHHPVVREWLDAQSPGHLSRGAERHAEMIAISDVLHAQDAATGEPTSLEQARRLFGNPVEFSPLRVRPHRQQRQVTALSCHSCLSALVHVGLFAPTITQHMQRHAVRIIALDRPDFPDALRSLVPPGGLYPERVSRLTGEIIREPLPPHVEQRPAALQEMARRYAHVGNRGSRPGQAHRIEEISLRPGAKEIFPELADDFGHILSAEVHEIGVENGGEGVIVADDRGRVFMLDQAGEWFLGADLDEALVTLLYGREQRRVRDDGTW